MAKGEHFFQMVVILGGLGGGLLWAGLRSFKVARRTQDTATSKLTSAPQGFVEVQGHAWPLEKSITPMNSENRSVVYKSMVFQKYVRHGKNSSWRTVHKSEFKEPFYILDETGVALVIPEGMRFETKKKTTAWSKLTEQQRFDLLANNGNPDLPVKMGLFSGAYRIIEEFIYLGSPIFVHASFSTPQAGRTPLPNSHLGLFQKEVVRLLRDPGRKQGLFDRNANGKISEEEAKVGYFMTALQVLKKDTSEPSNLSLCGTLQSHSEQISFIADCHQEHLMKRIGNWFAVKIAGGTALIIAAICLLMLEFKVF